MLRLLCAAANSSDSEDQSLVEGAAKSAVSKSIAPDAKVVVSPKCHGRSPTSSHKYHKQGDADHSQHRENHARSPRVYKWSFQMCKYHTVNATVGFYDVFNQVLKVKPISLQCTFQCPPQLTWRR